jgi:dTDP-4-amino-4,6-dideoxygalactose transaminase
MGISFYNFKSLHDSSFQKAAMERIAKIVSDGSFVEGEYNSKFESEFAKLQGSKHCLLVGNGTDALEISLLACGVRSGDKVGVPGITYYASAEAVINIGATPVLIDVEYDTGLICLDSLKRTLVDHKLKAVMPVHIYGLPADIKAINQLAIEHSFSVVEDAAQAQGANLETGAMGSSGNLTTFSFYPTKNLSAFGDAGCILTNSDEYADSIRIIRNHGRDNEEKLGRNSRCDHIQAAVLHLKLDKITQYNDQRKKVASMYHQELEGVNAALLSKKYLTTSAWHLYPIQLKDKAQAQKLMSHLKEKEIGNSSFYEKALSQEIPLSHFEGERAESEKRAGATVCLPIHPFLTSDEVKLIANEVKACLS